MFQNCKHSSKKQKRRFRDLKSLFDTLREWLPQSEDLISAVTALFFMLGVGFMVLIAVTIIFNTIGRGIKALTVALAGRKKPAFKGYF